jgi:2,4-dienoyl-CoA reductase-like NADH-dependent reductase (Old Yellow Enzyme family)
MRHNLCAAQVEKTCGEIISTTAFVFEGKADAVAFGKLFIANPDLVSRFRENLPLNAPDSTTFYAFVE